MTGGIEEGDWAVTGCIRMQKLGADQLHENCWGEGGGVCSVHDYLIESEAVRWKQ